MTPSGKFTFYPIPSTEMPEAITVGPDGALWFTEARLGLGAAIGRITTTGQVTEFPDSFSGGLSGIVTGPDGALWFTEAAGAIGRITTTGQFSHYPLPSPQWAAPDQITVGPDGALWFTDYQQDTKKSMVGRITTSGQITMDPVAISAFPEGIVTGPDGNLWVTEADDQHIAMVTTGGVATEYSIHTAGPGGGDKNTGYGGIIVGTDGNLYFAEGNGDLAGLGSIGEISTTGVVQHFSTKTGGSLGFLTTLPGGTIYFTDPGSGAIGVMSGGGGSTPTPTPTPTPNPTATPTHSPTHTLTQTQTPIHFPNRILKTPTPAPPPAAPPLPLGYLRTPPLILGISAMANRRTGVEKVTLHLDQPVVAGHVLNPNFFQIITAGADGKLGTSDDVTTSIPAVYNARHHTITLTLSRRLVRVPGPKEILVQATGVVNAVEQHLAGNLGGTPGSNYESLLPPSSRPASARYLRRGGHHVGNRLAR